MDRNEILDWLHQEDALKLEELWRRADSVRKTHVGGEVHFRGLVEISNHCVRRCGYCGLRAPNAKLPRYRMSADEVLNCARQAMQFGYGTVVLQAGEDPEITKEWIADLIRRIKACGEGCVAGVPPACVEGVSPSTQSVIPQFAVTLSLGERSFDELAAWKAAGADRYLLRFETSNRDLFDRIHPPVGDTKPDRIAILRQLRKLGYEVGSGVMIGIPGQSYEDLADDILLFAELDLDMIGVGPYLPHPQTPLGKETAFTTEDTEVTETTDSSETTTATKRETTQREKTTDQPDNEHDVASANRQLSIVNRQSLTQVPNTELMTYKVLALSRLACPRANIPSTTALATLNRATGRELGLQRGANVVMPNLTPPQYRAMYEIYPAKACIYETADACHACMTARVAAIGRTVGAGRGDSPNKNSKPNA